MLAKIGMVLCLAIAAAGVAPQAARAGECSEIVNCNNSCSEILQCSSGSFISCSVASQVISCSGFSTCNSSAFSVTCDGHTTFCKDVSIYCSKTSTSVTCGGTFKSCSACGGHACRLEMPKALEEEAAAAPAAEEAKAAACFCWLPVDEKPGGAAASRSAQRRPLICEGGRQNRAGGRSRRPELTDGAPRSQW